MAYEFKKLSDVEIVEAPADTANVLIEEDGVIKKAPKTAVGGNQEYDMVLKFTYSADLGDITGVIESGSKDDVGVKLDSLVRPNVLLVEDYRDGFDMPVVMVSECNIMKMINTDEVIYGFVLPCWGMINDGQCNVSILPDGTMEIFMM